MKQLIFLGEFSLLDQASHASDQLEDFVHSEVRYNDHSLATKV